MANEKSDREPLVSIVVITFNSAKFVLETLESIKAQTYQNIELIVSDDCSTDNTVEICRNWINENKERFVRTELITVEKNTGIPANCNRGYKAANGELIKGIAGDDILVETYINIAFKYFLNNPSAGAIFTNTYLINEKTKITKKCDSKKYKSGMIFNDIFFLNFWPSAPSFMFRKKIIEEMGFFDETIWVEDYLLILKISEKYPIIHINEFLTYYRRHNQSCSLQHLNIIDAHIETIRRYNTYYGYKKRISTLLLYKINALAHINKKQAINYWSKNCNCIYYTNFLCVKTFIKILCPLFLYNFIRNSTCKIQEYFANYISISFN